MTSPSLLKQNLLRAGVAGGIAMVVVPFVVSLIGMAFASNVPGGLRGATHMPEKEHEVGFALGTSSLLALLAPPGIFLAVGCGLALAGDRRRKGASEASPRSGGGRGRDSEPRGAKAPQD